MSIKQYDIQIEETLKNNEIKLFDVIGYEDSKIYIPIIEKVCIKDKIDYFELAYQALSIDSSNNWNIGNILVNLAPYSKIDIDNILKFYKLFHSKQESTSTHFQITKSLVSNNPTIAKILLEELLKINGLFIIPHISAILIELHNSNNESQYKTIVNYLKSNDVLKLKCVIPYMHIYNFSTKELKEIFGLFNEKVKLSNKEIDRALLYSSYDLIEKGYGNFSEILLLYIKNDDINIKSDLSQVLNYACKNNINEKWFRESVLSIIDVDIEQQNIIFNIELILKAFLEIDDYDYIKEFLYKWIEQGNLSSIFSKNTLSNFGQEFNEYKLFSRFITESLVYENNKLHKVLPDLIGKEITLDVATMKTFTFDDYLYVCRKILGYFYEFKMLNAMIFSILSVDDLSNETKQLVIEVIVNYIGKNYAYDTLEYYKGLDYTKLNDNEKEAKYHIVKKLAVKTQQIKTLPILKELRPSSQQSRLILRTKSIAMNKAMKEGEKDSFLSSLFSKIIIRYGKGSFSMLDGNFSNVMYLQSHSYSVTMPTSSRTHPIEYEYEKYRFRMIQKGQ